MVDKSSKDKDLSLFCLPVYKPSQIKEEFYFKIHLLLIVEGDNIEEHTEKFIESRHIFQVIS